jgi:hypothetical protein
VNPVQVVGIDEIRTIYARTPAAGPSPTGLIAFRAPGDPRDATIYVSRHSSEYTQAARKPSPLVLLKLAAVLAHEQVHNSDGEAAAYRLQADFVESRLSRLPWQQRDSGRAYARMLSARANVFARGERFRQLSSVFPREFIGAGLGFGQDGSNRNRPILTVPRRLSISYWLLRASVCAQFRTTAIGGGGAGLNIRNRKLSGETSYVRPMLDAPPM